MTPEQVVGAALRVRRWRDGLTIKALAAKSEISHPTWGRLEKGQGVRDETLTAVDAYYELKPGTTAAAVGDPGLAQRFAAILNPGDVIVQDQPGPGTLGHVPHHDPALPDLSGGAEQVRAQLYHLAQQVQLLGAVVTQTRRLVDEQEPDDVPEDARRALGALDYVCHTAQVPLFLAATSAENEALADVD